MDRHDVSETVTAEQVAKLHQEDLKIQDQFDCRGLTYWFDGKRKTAFCLVEAPNADAIKKMHAYAHGEVPNSIIEVDTGIVESFLGKIEYHQTSADTALDIVDEPAFRTIMVMLLKHASPERHNNILNIIDTYEGSCVKQNPTHFLVSFKSTSNAVHAALDIQQIFQNNETLKIGLTAGMPVTEKRSIFEDVIKLAERMCRVVNGKIIASSEVKYLYDSENVLTINHDRNIIYLNPTDVKFLTSLMDYTESAWNNVNLKVDDFSRPVGCSKSQLYRKITLLTGKSPNTFIRDYRLHEALLLLNKNVGNISEIAFETGFSSPSYFSKCFQKKYGRSPSGYLTVKPL